MENLKTIVQIISTINLKQSDFLVTDKRELTQTDIFYKKILSGEFQSDDEAATFFFNATTTHSGYRSLKHSLKEKLINTLFFIDPSKTYSDQKRAYLYCYKYLSASTIMIQLGARKIGRDLLKKVFNKALKFELTNLIIQSSKTLRLEYGATLMDADKFHYYNDIYKKYIEEQRMESLAEEHYITLLLPYSNSRAKQHNTAEKAKEYYEELAPFLEISESPFLHFIANVIKIISHLSVNDYKNVITTSEKALLFFEQKPYNYKAPIKSFLHHQLICYIQLKDWEKGKEIALKAINNVKVGSYSWYINQELRLMLALHSKEYVASYEIMNDALNHHKFRTLRNSLKERWIIHKAYISFLSFIGKIKIEKENKKKFRIGKFLNSLPIHSKDKKGLNIPILIIQILFMVVKKDYDQTIDRFEAIKKYCSRYLKENENLRSNCFINMLLQIPNSNFHKAGVERRSKKYLDKLLTTPLDISSQSHEIEMIPYEDLWAFVMESLDTKFYKF